MPRHRRSLEIEESPVRQEKGRLDKHKELDLMNSPIHTKETSNDSSSNASTINCERLNLEEESKESINCDFVENQHIESADNSKLVSFSSSKHEQSSNLGDYTTDSLKREDTSRIENVFLETDDNSNRSASDSVELDINLIVENKVCESESESPTIDRKSPSEVIMFKSSEENCDIEMSPNRLKIDDDASRRDIVVNQKNKRIVSNNSDSPVLIISEERSREDIVKKEVPVTPMTPPEKKKVKKIERPKSKPAAPPSPPIKVNRDDCDWDSLFDDNGDCLDPTLINEVRFPIFINFINILLILINNQGCHKSWKCQRNFFCQGI